MEEQNQGKPQKPPLGGCLLIFLLIVLLSLCTALVGCTKHEAGTPNPIGELNPRVDTAVPGQGVVFWVDTAWSGDTVIHFNPFAP